jgi:hypothetical protein
LLATRQRENVQDNNCQQCGKFRNRQYGILAMRQNGNPAVLDVSSHPAVMAAGNQAMRIAAT